ncbi:hypothetical protein RclHR1_09800009 [Rhizophagus clarus]|uniref:Uncharacterized protein n=1 Tax=Rhizophagus clarus TaxID=94130 RepID=A0A2Z6SFJ4_9GLOM|nr:hypothetical protein RclHR1_09800009 [Rhizophagus clarus]
MIKILRTLFWCFPSVETRLPAKGKNKQYEHFDKASSSEKPDSSEPSEVKQVKRRGVNQKNIPMNLQKERINRHLNHHEHKAEARRNQSIIKVEFLNQLDNNKIKIITQMQCIYFMAKKYLALSVYPDLYQLIDFHRKNSDVMKLCNTPEA